MDKLMKHKFLPVMVAMLVVGLLLASCAPQPAPVPAPASSPAPAPKPIKLRYSGGLPSTHPMSLRQKWFAEELQKRTNGRVIVEVYMNAELYDHSEVIDAVSTGAIEMGYTLTGRWGARSPVYGFGGPLFMLESLDHYYRTKDKLADILFPLMEKDNVKTLHWFAFGDLNLSGNKLVVKPEDIRGLIIQAGQKEILEPLNSLRVVPALMSGAEVYDALAKGAIDGTMSGWTVITSRKFYEVAKYTLGPFNTSPATAHINLGVWNSLPKDIQQTILELARETEELSFKDAQKADQEAIEFLKKRQTVTMLAGEVKTPWLKVARPYYDEWVERCQKAGHGSQAREIVKVLDATR